MNDSKCPELSLWNNLTELDLCHAPDEDAPYLLDMELPTCLPTSLRSLSLCRIAIDASAAARISSHLPHLSHLALSEFELGWGHLLALGGGSCAEGADRLRRQLNVLSICSSIPHAPDVIVSSPQTVNVPEAALRCFGSLRSLEYLLLTMPPMMLPNNLRHDDDSEASPPGLENLAPALKGLKVLGLHAPTNTRGWRTLDLNPLFH